MDEPLYFVSTKAMQYVFMRNYLKGEVIGRIYLDSFPTTLSYNDKKQKIVIGHDGNSI